MPTVAELHGHRVVGYFESPTSRVVVVAVKRPFDYAIYILWVNAVPAEDRSGGDRVMVRHGRQGVLQPFSGDFMGRGVQPAHLRGRYTLQALLEVRER